MRAYYNEHDPKKAAWLRELIADGQITEGDVDERSIADVRPGDLRGYRRCHFFAGIGVWDYALDLAGWGDQPVWTGSCPCPSFSCAGKGGGFDDPRHLWPAWFGLIRECRPSAIFGEQADDAIGYGWLDLVQSDLESEAYAVGKAVLGACSVGAPHRRQRLYFVGESASWRCPLWTSPAIPRREPCSEIERSSNVDTLADAEGRGQREHGSAPRHAGHPDQRQCVGELGDAEGFGRGGRPDQQDGGRRECSPGQAGAVGILGNAEGERRGEARPSFDGPAARTPWGSNAVWLPCKDGKLRAVEPVSVALADGIADLLGSVRHQGGRIFHPLQVKAPARRLRLHGYGDAIVSTVAAEFIRAFMEVANERD